MKLLFCFIFLSTFLADSFSQSISNVMAVQQGNNALISYDLNGTPGNSYYVKLYYSTDGGQTFGNELMQVTGDVKSGIKTGPGKKITWAAEKEVNYLNSSVVFKVEAESRKANAKPVTVDNITAEIVRAERHSEEVFVEYIIIQNTEDEIRRIFVRDESQLTTQDGTQYDPVSGKFGTQNMKGGNYTECPKGIPTKGHLTFKVESSELVISAIKLKVNVNGYLKDLVFRNVPIQ